MNDYELRMHQQMGIQGIGALIPFGGSTQITSQMLMAQQQANAAAEMARRLADSSRAATRSQYEQLFGPGMLAAKKETLEMDFNEVTKPKQDLKGEKKMFSQMREYIKEYRTIIFTVAFVALADHFLFEGAFRSRLKSLVESLLKKAELSKPEPKDAA